MRMPRGYVGKAHETIGSDILSVLGVVSMPAQTFGPELTGRLKDVKPDKWYPIGLLLEVMEVLDQKVGANGLRQMGRKLLQLSHEEHIKKTVTSAAQLLGGFDAIYKRANRGEHIGGWQVVSFAPGRCTMDKTTPHHCVMEEGILLQGLSAVGVPATVAQEQCFRKGAESCVYVISSVIRDARWGNLA